MALRFLIDRGRPSGIGSLRGSWCTAGGCSALLDHLERVAEPRHSWRVAHITVSGQEPEPPSPWHMIMPILYTCWHSLTLQPCTTAPAAELTKGQQRRQGWLQHAQSAACQQFQGPRGCVRAQVKQASVLRGLDQAHVESGVDRAADLLHSVASADPPRAIALSALLASEPSSPARDPLQLCTAAWLPVGPVEQPGQVCSVMSRQRGNDETPASKQQRHVGPAWGGGPVH